MKKNKVTMRIRCIKLRKTGFGARVLIYNSVNSTNSVACELAQQGKPEGTAVIATTQDQGRGRGGQTWHSPAGGIWLSVILKPQVSLEMLLPLGLAAVLALARAVEKVTSLRPLIKWPNDLTINGKKTAGILLESRSTTDMPEFVILGIGLNVNQTGFPTDLKNVATSLLIETNSKVSRTKIVLALFQELDVIYPIFLKNGLQPFLSEINGGFPLLNKTVKVESSGKIVEGTVMRIDPNGSLILKKGDGSVLAVISGSIL